MERPERVSAEQRQQSALMASYQQVELTLEQLWTRYFALGGDADLMDVEAQLTGLLALPPGQRDILAHAVNERLDELITRYRVPYSHPVRPGRPSGGPLAALVGLLESTGMSAPEHVPELARTAGRALGVEVSLHLIDHEQRGLVRLPAPDPLPARG